MDGKNPRVGWKRGRSARRECGEMDKVMNEEIHLAGKKRKNEDSEKCETAEEPEWVKTLSDNRERGKNQAIDRERGRQSA